MATADPIVSTHTMIRAFVYLLVAVAVFELSALGEFRSMATFPWIFGGIWVVIGVLEVVRAWRKRGSRLVLLLVGAGIVCVAAAPFAQGWTLGRQARREEARILESLGNREAPALAWERGFNLPSPGWRPELEGKITVLNFWATWCAPCVEELPMLERVAAENDSEHLQVIGVTRLWGAESGTTDAAEEEALVERFLVEHGVTYPNLLEHGDATHAAFGAGTLPTTVLIDASGRLVDLGLGIDGSERILEQASRMASRMASQLAS